MCKENIIKKIRNLLNVTTDNGATPAEMETALALADKLMDTYAISLEQVENLQEKTSILEGEFFCIDTKNTTEYCYMAKAIAELFHCDVILQQRRDGGRRAKSYLKFVGTSECIGFCEFLITEIYLNVLKSWMQFSKVQKFSRHTVLTAKYSFERGYFDAVTQKCEKLLEKEKSPEVSSCTSLVVIDSKVKDYMTSLNLKAHRMSTTPRMFSESCYNSGFEKGKQQSLNKRANSNSNLIESR